MGIRNTSGSFARLSDSDLRSLAMGLESGRISVPCSALQIRRLISGSAVDSAVSAINSLAEQSFSANQVAACLNLLSLDQLSSAELADAIAWSNDIDVFLKSAARSRNRLGDLPPEAIDLG